MALPFRFILVIRSRADLPEILEKARSIKSSYGAMAQDLGNMPTVLPPTPWTQVTLDKPGKQKKRSGKLTRQRFIPDIT